MAKGGIVSHRMSASMGGGRAVARIVPHGDDVKIAELGLPTRPFVTNYTGQG